MHACAFVFMHVQCHASCVSWCCATWRVVVCCVAMCICMCYMYACMCGSGFDVHNAMHACMHAMYCDVVMRSGVASCVCMCVVHVMYAMHACSACIYVCSHVMRWMYCGVT